MLLHACFLLLVLKTHAQVPRLYEAYTASPDWTESSGAATTLKTGTNLNDPSEAEGEETSTELAALEEFLKNYGVERPRNRYFGGNRWDLMQAQKHSHPYDDRKGWVSLEPVPWSVSKISKWHSKYKPQESAGFDFDFNTKRPFKQRPPPNTYHYQQNVDGDDDTIETEAGFYNKRPNLRPVVSASFAQKLHIKNTISDPDYSGEIITDGLPANFPESQQPQHGYNRRQSATTEPSPFPAAHPFAGDVLPPLKGSKVNMTTSHGGLLQVESTFQTVEQAAQKVKRQKQKQKVTTTTTRRPPPQRLQHVRRKEAAAATVTTRNNAPDTSAVLAAVGAGMIPATMAMLLPMAMGGRKKRESRSVTGRPAVVEITLPRSL